MKPPKPTEGVARHSWGRRRRIAKKTEKGLWKAMARLGLLEWHSAEDCSWESMDAGHSRKKQIPRICGWEHNYGGDWSEYPIAVIAHSHLDAPSWKDYDYDAMQGRSPAPIAKNDYHALRLLRKEIRRTRGDQR